jgi:4a-hydroxytetrahydrobiopterin dehydratase
MGAGIFLLLPAGAGLIVCRCRKHRNGTLKDLASKKCKPCEGGAQPLSMEQARELMRSLHDSWRLDEATATIERHFEFKAFSRTIAFANAVAWIATNEGHHPQLIINYGSCNVQYRTHAVDGLSDNDFICAAKIDRLAEEL